MGGLLDPLAFDPARACLLTDFDGTLAPIVEDPYAARPLPGAVEVLAHLAARLRTVGVVSGRPAAWLHGIVGDGVTISGLYGLELVAAGSGGHVDVSAEVERWRAVVDAVAYEARASAPPGVLVEHKGLALTIHLRRAAAEEDWVSTFCAEAAARTGLQIHTAKMSLELRPPVMADKGTVVRSLAEGATAVAYLGDDVGDLPAFAALDALAASGVTTLKVAVGGPELDRRVADAAHVVLAGPEACLGLLVDLSVALG
jgi:trehalose 6-phosphate phosphatase